MNPFSHYDDQANVAASVARGEHRELVGGLWDEIGSLQLEFLRANGLKPHSRLLDIGCGSLRLGIRAVDYLDAGNYWGTDANESLMVAGFESEIVPAGLAHKLPRDHLVVDADFAFPNLPHDVDFAIAQSVFTHLPLNHMRLCLENLAAHVDGPCRLFITIFIAPDGQLAKPAVHQPGGVVTYPHRDPYHCSSADLRHAASGLPWSLDFVGDWNHPRGQKIAIFRKVQQTVETAPPLSTREVPTAEAAQLAAGANHYRAYVGPPDRYDFMSATQFALLFALGLRDHHRVLDFGCGSLRLGRLLIPFLQASRYFGIDPNKWLIDDALDHELGHDILTLKKPAFAHNADFSTDVFQASFDFIMAQSILTHAGPDLMDTFLRSAARSLTDSGLLLFSYIKSSTANEPLPGDGWHYPHCVAYVEHHMLQTLERCGLHGVSIPWFHPGAAWMVASRSAAELPNAEQMQFLAGAVLRSPQFSGSASNR